MYRSDKFFYITLAFMEDRLIALALGSVLGIAAAMGIFVSHLGAARFGRGNHVLEILIRLVVFGVILVGAGELIGANFGSFVRQYPAWFFGAVAALFVATPWAFGVLVGHRGPRHER